MKVILGEREWRSDVDKFREGGRYWEFYFEAW